MEIVKITCSTCNCVCLGYLSACLINVSAIEHVFSLIYADLISKLALLLFVMAGKDQVTFLTYHLFPRYSDTDIKT